jgi:Tfp pilus assembly protein PilX
MKISNNEKGIALVLALIMLALLSILGAYALSTSSTELFIAGNYRNTELAFTSADAGAEYGLNQVRLNSAIVNPTTGTWPVAGAGSGSDTNFNTIAVGPNRAEVKITRVTVGERPIVGIKSSASTTARDTRESSNERGNMGSLTEATYYVVHSVGYGPANSRVEVECMLWRPAISGGMSN